MTRNQTAESKLHDAIYRLEQLEDDLKDAGLTEYRKRLTDARSDIADAELTRLSVEVAEKSRPGETARVREGTLEDAVGLITPLFDETAPRVQRIRAALIVAVLGLVAIAVYGGLL